MAEMLERQPPEVQSLLLRTSVLDRVNGELADLRTGATEARHLGRRRARHPAAGVPYRRNPAGGTTSRRWSAAPGTSD
jgi:hypothetical protein